MLSCEKSLKETNRSRDDKTREEVEKSIESSSQNSCNLLVRGDGNCHHPVVCEVEEGEE